ncbi:diacylglycerol kinase [Campylobacter coli]
MLITEALNSAIEACVDLITNEWHEYDLLNQTLKAN